MCGSKGGFLGQRGLNLWSLIINLYVGVSKNRGTPKSSIFIGFSIIHHQFWGTPIFGNTHVYVFSTVFHIFFHIVTQGIA